MFGVRLLIITLLFPICAAGQIDIAGYLFESGNRGFIEGANVQAANVENTEIYGTTFSDHSGKYELRLPAVGKYRLIITKPPCIDYNEVITVSEEPDGITCSKHEISRLPGYILEMTLAEENKVVNDESS